MIDERFKISLLVHSYLFELEQKRNSEQKQNDMHVRHVVDSELVHKLDPAYLYSLGRRFEVKGIVIKLNKGLCSE